MIKDILQDAEERMTKAMDALRRDLNTIRTGRAAPSLLDRISVEYYGAPTPLNQIAGISAPDARTLMIQPWDRGSLGAIEKAIMKSDVGLQPNNDGTVIRLNIPQLTEDRRKQFIKQVHGMIEDAKIAVRNIRRDTVQQTHKLANDRQVSEDEERRGNTQLDELSKRFTDEADKIGKAKEQELLEV